MMLDKHTIRQIILRYLQKDNFSLVGCIESKDVRTVQKQIEVEISNLLYMHNQVSLFAKENNELSRKSLYVGVIDDDSHIL